MPLAFGALLFGAILLVAGFQGRSLLNVALGREDNDLGLDPLTPDSPSVQNPEASGGTARGAGGLPSTQGGLKIIDGKPVASWIVPILLWAKRNGWTGQVLSGYRDEAHQAQLYAEWQAGKRVGPVGKPGSSNHQGKTWPRGAVDVSEPYQLAKVLKRYPGLPGFNLRQGLAINDPPHFSATGR